MDVKSKHDKTAKADLVDAKDSFEAATKKK